MHRDSVPSIRDLDIATSCRASGFRHFDRDRGRLLVERVSVDALEFG